MRGAFSVSHTLVWEGRRLCSDGGKTRAQQHGRTHLSYPRAQPPHPAGRLSGRPGNILVSFAPHGQSLTPAACSALENTERSSPVRPRSPRLYASQPDTGATQSHPTPRGVPGPQRRVREMPSSPPAGGQGTEAQRVGTVSGGSSKDGSTCKAGAEGVDGKTVYRNVGSVREPARAGWCAPGQKPLPP